MTPETSTSAPPTDDHAPHLLVYLDNSHIAWLRERAYHDPGAAGEYVRRWNAAGAVLALGAPVLLEIAQQEHESDVEATLRVLSRFSTIVCAGLNYPIAMTGDYLIACEVIDAYRSTLCDVPARGGYQGIPLRHLWKLTNVGELREHFRRGRVGVQRYLRDRGPTIDVISLGRRARSKAKGKPEWPPRRLLGPPPGLSIRAYPWMNGRRPPMQEAAAWRAYVAPMASSPRDWELRSWNVRDVPCLKGKPMHDVHIISGIIHTAMPDFLRSLREHPEIERIGWMLRDMGLRHLPSDPELRQLDYYQLPGITHHLALVRAQDFSGGRMKPGDLGDAEHILFAPYVDLLFADGISVKHLNQERKDRPELIRNGATPVRVETAATLDVLISRVEALAEELRPATNSDQAR